MRRLTRLAGPYSPPKQRVTYPPVHTKADFVRRFRAGEFGNRGPLWDTPEEFGDTIYTRELVHLRNRVAGGPTWYDLPQDYALLKWLEMPDPSSYYCALMAPTAKTTLQGEVQLQPGGLALHYTHVAKPMREALAISSHHARGIIGVSLLRTYLCANSYDWLQVLLERYPDHVIEFSSFSCNWGTIPHYNTVWWEVRNY